MNIPSGFRPIRRRSSSVDIGMGKISAREIVWPSKYISVVPDGNVEG